MMMFKKFVALLFILFLSLGVALADEGDLLPENQRACYETAPVVNRMELVVPDEPPDPTVNWGSHYLNNESGRQLSHIAFITPKNAVIKLFSGISVGDFIRVHDDLVKLKDYTDIRDVTLVINSPGGDAFTGLAIASLVLKARHEWGFNIRAQGFAIVASAAVPVLAVCEPRHVAEGTLIMVHEAALFKWPGRETASDIESQNELMKMLADRYIKFLVDSTTTSANDWLELIENTTWMTPETAKTLGLVDEVK